jgi:aldehyde dehydrogenase (NAD+)
MTVREIYESLPYGPAPEAANLAEEWLEKHGRAFGHWIGGEWVKPNGSKSFETLNPSSGKPIATVSQAGPAEVDLAVEKAAGAFSNWSRTSGFERAKRLYAIARQIQKHARLFAVLETLDNGKPIRETRDLDIPLVARHFYHHAGWAQLMETEMAGYGPVGVCGQIIPWNFPLLMLAWKIAPAIAMGNTVILKPAEFTPLTALLFGEICEAAGLPPGVVNILTGDGETGRLMVEHPGIQKIAFTGSTEVGRILRKATAGTGKKLSLELGGKSPFVVFDDADLDGAVEGLVDAIWFNQGQVCCAGSRLLVQEGVAETVLAKVRARMENLRVGDPLDKAVDIGAIIAPVQLERIRTLVETGQKEGAEMFQPTWACPKEGWFYPPTLLSNVAPSSTVAQVEIFGPVLVAMTFRTPAEAVELANNTTYGLAGSVWTENVNLALDVAAKIKAGTIWVNCTNMFDAASGFGGYRESGFGREGGKEGLWEYVKAGGSAQSHRTHKSHKSYKTYEPDKLATPRVDRTPKLYIGGKQVRPDQGYSVEIKTPSGEKLGEVGRGNRKDIRNAVEAAIAAQKAWAGQTAHTRAQVIYYIGENLSARTGDFAGLLRSAGFSQTDALAEVEASLEAIFEAAAWADKHDGAVHGTAFQGITYTVNEPIGVLGIVCPERPALLGFVKPVLAAAAMGNALVALPSQTLPLAATELYQVFDTSDLPGGVVNIVTGPHAEIEKTLFEHDGVDGVWHFGAAESAAELERLSAGNLKQTWTSPSSWNEAKGRAPEGPYRLPAAKELIRHATQVKNVWVPKGE